MKRKMILGAGAFAIVAVISITACHHRSPEARIGWIKEEIADRLELDAAQKQQLDQIAADLLGRRQQIHKDRDTLRKTLMAELKKERIDRSVIEGLVAAKRQQMEQMVAFFIDSAMALHETLTPPQREKLVAELEKFHARAEKYGHPRWQ